MTKTPFGQDRLLEQFITSFKNFDEMIADEILSPIAWQLSIVEPDQSGYKHWEPKKVETSPSDLDLIYAKLPGRFPRLFEKLVLKYRWAEVDLGFYRLLANPPGEGLTGLLQEISRYPGLWAALLPAGYIQFAKGPDVDYDPVCFDIRNRKKNGECRIVKIDHEEILCNNRVKVVAELAPSFRELILKTLDQSKMK